MARERYKQQEAARKRWRGKSPVKGGRRRPVAYRVIGLTSYAFMQGQGEVPYVLDTHPVEGDDSNALQRAYRRAKRQADNVNGTVKPIYKLGG